MIGAFNPLKPIEDLLTDLLEWFHATVGLPWAWSIVALVVLVRLLLVPVTVRQIHSMQNLQAHAPEMKEIQQSCKHDKQRQNEELMKFYRENKINPASSCLPIVLQIPIFIALFFVLRDFEKEIFPHYPASSLEFLGLVEHHRADDRRLGAAPARRLRREPADVVVLHVGVDAEGAADPAARPADRLHPVHPQLPLRPDDLLDDDEPVDDRPGLRHAAADAEARPHGGRGKQSSRTPPKDEPPAAEAAKRAAATDGAARGPSPARPGG